MGDPALTPGVSAVTTLIVNGSVALTLGVVAAIIKEEPASITDEKAVWGPLTQPLWLHTFQFTMTQKDGLFSYVLERKSKSGGDGFVAVLTGSHNPKLANASGDFVLGAMDEGGRAEVSYQRSRNGDVQLQIGFRDQTKGSPDSDYKFSQAVGGDGQFEFVVNSDFDRKSAKTERLAVKSRWHDDGSGRADVTIVGGDTQKEVRFTECWDKALARSHYADTVALFPAEGAATDCTFSDASFSAL